jgi:hypothetical protein
VTSRVAQQIATYGLSALAAGAMFYMWRRLDEQDRQRVWPLYGWFSGLMLCGSCIGAVTWAVAITTRFNSINGNHAISNGNNVQAYSSFALSSSWGAVFAVSYAIEFLCLSAAKLMVLDRMFHFATSQGDGKPQRWAAGGRIVMAVVLLGNAVGLAANVAVAVYLLKASEAISAASANYVSNNVNVAMELEQSARENTQLAGRIASVQSFCEVAVLLFIVAAFVVVGVLCARRVSSALSILDTAGPETAARGSVTEAAKALGRQMRQEVVVTSAFVFVAFVLRSVIWSMLAFARQFQDTANVCPGLSVCDSSCYNEFSHIVEWANYTPEFLPMAVLISSPLALLVALWGMTPKRTLQLMKSSKRGKRAAMALGPMALE